MSVVHVILPNDIDDPAAPSGGNHYDRRVCDGLAALGWSVREHAVRGAWPRPTGADRARLAGVLAAIPHDAVVLLDGLIASTVPEVLAAVAGRLRLVVLVHLPLGEDPPTLAAERAALGSAAAVLTTSRWTRHRLLDLYGLPAGQVHAAPPGVDLALAAPGSAAGTGLLCVAAVAHHKGHDVLVGALAEVADQVFTCVCVGSLERDPDFVVRLRERIRAGGVADRVQLAGARTGARLRAAYAAADLLVLPSRGESYGMVVTEALARGMPVLATAVGGLPEALGTAPDGSRPGLLVPPDDPAALAGALRRWLGDSGLRARLRRSAMARRAGLTGWGATAELVSGVLSRVATSVGAGR